MLRTNTQRMTFAQLGFSNPILKALEDIKYQTPTPIQLESIPIIKTGNDLFGCAQTGTGKTAAFSLPIIENLSKRENLSGIKALILAPTRELAAQIGENIEAYSKNTKVKSVTIFGGVSQVNQIKAMAKGCHILVATPGRLLDLLEQNLITLRFIEFFVLDEADRMLDMGFIHDIKKILKILPTKRQSLFFSATATAPIMELANSILHKPQKVAVTPISTPSEIIKQSVFFVKKEDKKKLLKNLIQSKKINHALVFTRTKHGADRVAKDLTKAGIQAAAIHGNKSQSAREKALFGFKNRDIRVLVATDIAARGIDVDKLSHVINYEIPEVAETYIHRIGRTGRAGNTGRAYSFCTEEEKSYLKGINKLLKKPLLVEEMN